ncbi:MAG: hypothetical protein ABI876_09970, partial [Bacteroidota bacterium]
MHDPNYLAIDAIMTTTKAFVVRSAVLIATVLFCSGGELAAQPSSPVQVDFSQPSVPAGPQVNTFTGAFTYGVPILSVPGPNGGGYSLTLSYNSNTPVEDGASWVGFGWSLNPGAIIRDVKGYPDDTKDSIVVWNKSKRLWQVVAAGRVGIERASGDFGTDGKLAYSRSVIYSNEHGFAVRQGFDLNYKGIADLNITSDEAKTSYGFTIDPSLAMKSLHALGVSNLFGSNALVNGAGEVAVFAASGLATGTINRVANEWINGYASSVEATLPPAASPRYTGGSVNYDFGALVIIPPWFHLGAEVGLSGNFTYRDPVPNYSSKGIGFMYSSSAGASDIMDYFSEKTTQFRFSNPFLPIPFAAPDNYMITGGAPGGAMRLYNRGIGEFRPDYVHNTMSITNGGFELNAGARWGLGAGFGIGRHSFELGQWNRSGSSAFTFDSVGGDRSVFFRYDGDLGGSLLHAEDDRAVSAAINDDGDPDVPSNLFSSVNHGDRPGSIADVEFNLNRDLADTTDKGVPYKAFNKDRLLTTISDFLNRDEDAIAKQIGEIAITDGTGNRYVYGLPVYARAQRRFSLGMQKIVEDSASHIKSRSLAYGWLNELTDPIAVGEERPMPYAVAHLLTCVTAP